MPRENAPIVTIITTSLDRRDLLRKTLESVLAQTYPAVEQLVLDGGSTDGTQDLLKSYEKKFKEKSYAFHWVSEKDSGQGEAMNKGLRMATGDYILVLNSDDFFYDDSLGKYMRALTRDPSIDLIYGDHETLDEKGATAVIRHKLYTLNDILNRAYQIPQSAAIFRRTFVEKIGYFDESLRHVAEHEYFLRIMKNGGRTRYFPEILQVTLEHSGRKTTANLPRSWRETKMVNFRNGASYFSRFYILYLKNVHCNGFFSFMQRYMPKVYNIMKFSFNKVTHGK